MGYYDAPSDKIFEEIRTAAIEIWSGHDDTFGYATEKIDRVKALKNVKDNWGTMVGMFDSVNQRKLYLKLSPEARAKVNEWLL